MLLVSLVLGGGILLTMAGFFSNYTIEIKEKVKEKVHKFHKLNKAVSKQHPHKYKISVIFISLHIVSKAYTQQLVDYLNIQQGPQLITDSSQRGLGNGVFYALSYKLYGKEYTQIIKYKRGPKPISKVFNGEGEDITEMFLPYLGPNNDFFGVELTPAFFRTNKLVLIDSHHNSIEIGENEIIKI